MDPSGEQDIGWWIQNTIASAFGGSVPTEVQSQISQEASAYKQAGKEIGTFIVRNSPGTGDIGDVYNTIAGIDFYTGKKISSEDRMISGLAMVVPGVSGKEIKLSKESGTKVMSKSFYLTIIKGGRIDVENPQTRPGQIHLQIEGHKSKYYLNTLTNQFHIESTNGILAAKSIQNVLKKVDVQKAILKAKNVLGIN